MLSFLGHPSKAINDQWRFARAELLRILLDDHEGSKDPRQSGGGRIQRQRSSRGSQS